MDEQGTVLEAQAAAVTETLTSPEVVELLAQVRRSAPALTRTLVRLGEFERSGALDTVLDLAQVVQAARVSMGDGMIHRIGDLVRVLGETVDTLIATGLPEKAPALLQAVEAAKADAKADPNTIGLMGLMKTLKQPEVQFALKFMLALARRLPEAAREE